MITDDVIIEEAIRLTEEGICVTLPVNGNSMLPFIIGGHESVILQKPILRFLPYLQLLVQTVHGHLLLQQMEFHITQVQIRLALHQLS